MKYKRGTILKHRRDWLRELRSGNREQVDGVLCQLDEGEPVGFCCLGVAADMAKVPYSAADGLSRRVYRGADDIFNEYLVLPLDARDWLGVTEADPRLGFDFDNELHLARLLTVLGEPTYRDLLGTGMSDGWEFLTPAQLNDSGLTFAQIADVIEAFGFDASADQLQGA